MPRFFAAIATTFLVLGLTLPAWASDPQFPTSVTAEALPAGKQTKAGLYLTAAEAAALLETRDDVVLIDVRTPEETVLVGHATLTDVNLPIAYFDPTHVLKPSGSYAMQPNPAFIALARDYLAETTPMAALIICRSGGRSARAVDALTSAGVDLPLYTIVDGFEGDKDADGRRTVNGWKNSGGDWTFAARPDLLLQAE